MSRSAQKYGKYLILKGFKVNGPTWNQNIPSSKIVVCSTQKLKIKMYGLFAEGTEINLIFQK